MGGVDGRGGGGGGDTRGGDGQEDGLRLNAQRTTPGYVSPASFPPKLPWPSITAPVVSLPCLLPSQLFSIKQDYSLYMGS